MTAVRKEELRKRLIKEMFAPALQFSSSVSLMSFLTPDLYGLSEQINLEWFHCQKRHKAAPEHTHLLQNQNEPMAARRHLIASAKFYTKSALAGCFKTPKQTSKHLCYDQILFEMTSRVFLSLISLEVGLGDISHAICMCISVKPVPWSAVNLHYLFSNRAAVKTQSRSSLTSYPISLS